ncbi:MAG TPA: ArsR family transcriptional regulator [Methanotrichaceae archaeon]|nr:ArsR family transcriptional regulator [Methanotrichaceae archaeon]
MILDPVELLDILGNENRRRILQLLSFRPFYFNEMAKRLDVGPKAVIDHLEMLERAGLIECYQDRGRRKYFRIVRKTVLEVAVSPHTYGVRTYRSEEAAPSVPSTAKEPEDVPVDMVLLHKELSMLEEKRHELRTLMDEVESKEMEVRRLAVDAIQSYAQDQLEAEILAALLSGSTSAKILAEKMEMPEVLVEDRLKRLEARKAVQRRGEEWSI